MPFSALIRNNLHSLINLNISSEYIQLTLRLLYVTLLFILIDFFLVSVQ